MNKEPDNIRIAPASDKDMGALLQMVRREAEYERYTDGFAATEDRLRATLLGARPAAEAVLAWAGEQAVGFTVFFTTFSTFSAQCGLYMEDLFVEEKWRGHGVGRKLLAHVAARALDRGCHSVTWSVFKWNENAIRFYRGIGGEQLEKWDHFSLAGAALRELARTT